MSHSLQYHGLQHTRLLRPPLSPGVCSDSCPLSRWSYLTISPSVDPFPFYLQSFPASGSSFQWPRVFFFALGGQSTGASASASILPMNIQGSFPSGFTDLILQSKGSPAPQFKSISFYVLSPLFGPTLTLIHDNWKNHSFDNMELSQQSNITAF